MKKSKLSTIFIILAMLGLVFAAAMPVLAQGEDPGDPVPPPDNGGDIVIIPDTGSDNDPGLFSIWTLLIILGVVIVVLLIALVARGSSPRV
jgi:flagellar basal body-associated protein FliL